MINTDLYRIIPVPEANIDLAGIETISLLKNENKVLKQVIFISITILMITIIYINKKNERREEN